MKPKKPSTPNPSTTLQEIPPFLNVKEVAELLRTTTKAIHNMVHRGQLPGVLRPQGMRRLLFERDVLLDWIQEGRAASKGGVQ